MAKSVLFISCYACLFLLITTSCNKEKSGCTDPFAINYDPNAEIDDGNCQPDYRTPFEGIYSCVDSTFDSLYEFVSKLEYNIIVSKHPTITTDMIIEGVMFESDGYFEVFISGDFSLNYITSYGSGSTIGKFGDNKIDFSYGHLLNQIVPFYHIVHGIKQ